MKNYHLKETLRIYDPLWEHSKGKVASVGYNGVNVGPQTYSLKYHKSGKPAGFQKEQTKREPMK